MPIFAPTITADMAKLVDVPDLGSGAARRVGSSPIIRTKKASEDISEAFLFSKMLIIDPNNSTTSFSSFLYLSQLNKFNKHI